MKIFYAVQATGNGHIARAKELLPFLKKYGDVDVFLSGENSSLNPGFDIAYRSKGLGFFYNNSGGLNFTKTIKSFQFKRVWKEAHDLPLEKYDLIINDFESITALSCQIKKLSSIGFGHQASFQSSKVPRPSTKSPFGELVLKKYGTASHYIGLHFQSYDDFIYNPVVKQSIQSSQPTDKGHVTVYLSHYGNMEILKVLSQCKDIRFQVFSPKVAQAVDHENVQFFPVDNKEFTKSMLSAHGVITGAGFETPAEVLFLQKKLLCLPIKNQYEQLCNAAALKDFQVPALKDITLLEKDFLRNWYEENTPNTRTLTPVDNAEIIEKVVAKGLSLQKSKAAITTAHPDLPILQKLITE